MPPDVEDHPAPSLPGLATSAIAVLCLFVAILTISGAFLSTPSGRKLMRYLEREWGPRLFPQEIPPDALQALENAVTLQTYLLDGNPETNTRGEFKHEVGLHAYKILSEATIEEPHEITRIATGIKEGIYSAGMPAACFAPRHAVNVSNDDGSFDFLICFECGWVYIYRRDEKTPLAGLTFSGNKERMLDLFPSGPGQESSSP